MRILKLGSLDATNNMRALVSMLHLMPESSCEFEIVKAQLSEPWSRLGDINIGFRDLGGLQVQDCRGDAAWVPMFDYIVDNPRYFDVALNPDAWPLWLELRRLVFELAPLSDWRFIRNRHTLPILLALKTDGGLTLQSEHYQQLFTAERSTTFGESSQKVIKAVRRDFRLLGLERFLDRVPVV